MTRTPDTPAELAAMATEPATPYNRPVVEEAMAALDPDNGANAGDLQAVAERCIDLLKCIAANDLERHSKHCDVVPVIREALWNLEASERFLEECPFICMNDND